MMRASVLCLLLVLATLALTTQPVWAAPPPAPTITTQTPLNGKVELAWNYGNIQVLASITNTYIEWKLATATDQAATTAGDPTTGWVRREESGILVSQTIVGLTNEVAYNVRIKGFNADGGGPYSTVTITPTATGTPPAQAEGLSVSPGVERLHLTWNATSGATGYEVRYTDNLTTGHPVAAWNNAGYSDADAKPQHNIRDLTPGKTYKMIVRATNEHGDGSWSASSVRGVPVENVARTYEIVGVAQACEGAVANVEIRVSPRIPHAATASDDTSVLNLVTSNGSAGSPDDYTGGTFSIGYEGLAKSATDTVTLPITISADNLFEGNEDFHLTVSPGDDYSHFVAGGRTTATIVICDKTVALAASSSDSDTGTFTSFTLDPVFETGTTAYTATVAKDQTHVKLTPSWSVAGVSAKVGKFTLGTGTDLEDFISGGTNNPIALDEGPNALTARVTYPITGGPDIRDYHVTIMRDYGNSNANLAVLSVYSGTSAASLLPTRLTLSPDFNPDITQYTATVDSSITHVQIWPSASDTTGATIQAGKQGTDLADVPGGLRTAAIALEEDRATAITVRVTAVNGNTRDYTVTVIRSATEGDVDPDAPRIPRNFRLAAGNRTISASWDAPLGDPTHYDGQFKAATAGEWTTVSGIPASNTTWEISVPNNGVAYDVRVRARNSHGNGAWSEVRQAIPLAGPAAPQGLAVVGQFNSLAVSWNALPETAHVNYYQLQYKPTSRSDWRNVPTQVDDTRWTIHSLPGGMEYQARVRGVNDAGHGQWSSPVTATTTGPEVPFYHAMFGLRLWAGDGSLSLGWNEVYTEATGYQVEYKQASAPDQAATTAGDPATGWVDAGYTGEDRAITITGLTNFRAYDVRVRGVYASGYGPWVEATGTPRYAGRVGTPTAVALDISPNPAQEGQTVTLTATLNDLPPVTGATVYFFAPGVPGTGKAHPVSDFNLSPDGGAQGATAAIRLDPGETTATATLEVLNDGVNEGNETVSISVYVFRTGPTLGNSGTLTIEDPPSDAPNAGRAGPVTAVSLALSAATVSESAGDVTVTATLDQPAPAGGLELRLYASPDDTAERDADYTMPESLTVPFGQRSGTATVSITGDALDESDETAVIGVSAQTDHATLNATATLTITDDDTAGVTVSAASPVEVAEGGTATYTVVLDSRPTADVTVAASSGDTGAATVSPASHTFTASDWNTPATFTVSGVADTDSDDETVGISHSVTSTDAGYGSVVVSTVSVAVSDTTPPQQQGQDPPANRAPTVSSAIADATIVSESGTQQVSLSGVFSDADNDALTITAASSDTAKATVSVASDYASLTVTAKARGTATITVTANDGRGGTVQDTFTVTVKAAPVVASALADLSLEVGATPEVSLSGVFSDADGDTLTVTTDSTDENVANAFALLDTLYVTAFSAGTATVTVTAQDTDGNTVSDQFAVTVAAPQQDPPPNRAPTVASAIADATIVNESGTQQVSLSGTFSDADNDALTVTAASSDTAVATVSVAAGHSSLTVSAQARGTATVTVTAADGNGGTVSDSFTVTVKAAPVVANALADVSIVNESGTQQVSLSGTFSDADGDSLTFAAASSDDAVATVSVAGDYSSLTVTAQARGTATVTVTASDGDGGTVGDSFTVTVKAAPVVASALADVSGLEEGATQDVSLSGVFSDADGDALTVTAASSDGAIATVAVAAGGSALTLAGVAEGTATVTVTAQDTDGNRVSDDLSVSVVKAPEPEPDPPTGAPTVAAPIDDFSLEGHEHKEFDLSGVFHDPDGDALSFSAVSSKYHVATMWVDGSTLTVLGTGTGMATITVTAKDPDGNQVSDEFEVTVRPAS